MRTVIVTGGAGFIGSHCVRALLDRGERVVVVDDFDGYYDPARKAANVAPFRSHGRFTLVQADIRDAGRMRAVCADAGKDATLIHLAARAGVRASFENPGLYEDVNVRGTTLLLRVAADAGLRRFVLASSSSVYGERTDGVPFKESDALAPPRSPYAASKRRMEEAARAFQDAHPGTAVICPRFFTVYGPAQRPDMAIHKFARAIAAGELIPVFGDGTTYRDYTFVDDVVAGILAAADAADRPGFRVYNLGASRPTPLHDMIAALERALGADARIDRREQQPGDVSATFADVSLAARELGYRPQVMLEEGIGRFVEWFRGTGK